MSRRNTKKSTTSKAMSKPFEPATSGVRTDQNQSLGSRLRRARLERGLTLAQVAEKTGLSSPTLSKIENARRKITFTTAIRISEALELPISSLVGPVHERGNAGRRSMTRAGEGRRVSAKGGQFEVLCDELVHKRNVYWKLDVTCRDIANYGEYSRHPGEEFIYVLSGAIDLHTDLYSPLRLNAGDSILFDSGMGHAYIAASKETPRLLIANTLAAGDIQGFQD
jgi:transcriptional regulator with XRE-family HTH domain